MRIVSCFETADPLFNWTRRMRLDAVLLLLFFVVMYDRLTQNPLHEMLGTASLLIVCTHLLVNRTWLRQHFGTWFGMEVKRPRRPKAKSRVGTISNIVLFATFSASFISGVMCSQTLFASVTPQVWRMDLSYRTVHVSLSMWFFLAAAVHVGLHARLVLDKWETSLKTRVPGWVVIFGKYGILAILIVLSVQIWVRHDFLLCRCRRCACARQNNFRPELKNKKRRRTELAHLLFLEFRGRGGGIRTRDPLHPMQVRYQAALRPERVAHYAAFEKNFQVIHRISRKFFFECESRDDLLSNLSLTSSSSKQPTSP